MAVGSKEYIDGQHCDDGGAVGARKVTTGTALNGKQQHCSASAACCDPEPVACRSDNNSHSEGLLDNSRQALQPNATQVVEDFRPNTRSATSALHIRAPVPGLFCPRFFSDLRLTFPTSHPSPGTINTPAASLRLLFFLSSP